MSTWLLDITTFVRVVSDEQPTSDEITTAVQEETRQIIENMHVEVTRA